MVEDQMRLDEFTALLDERGYAYTRTEAGIDVTARREVYLGGLTALPENVTFSNGGGIYLRSLTTLPENVTFSNGGGVDLRSLTTLPENVTFSNGGYVDLGGLTDEYQTHRGEIIRLKYVDGQTMLILSERVTGEYIVFHAAYFGGGDLDKLKRCYVAQLGEFYAHGATVEKAMRDVRFKSMEREFDQDELVAEIKARGTVLIEDFRLVTGACEEGTRHGMEQAGLDPKADELPLDVVLGAAFGSYGERFKALFVTEAA
mgnify:CR=1 FL=1